MLYRASVEQRRLLCRVAAEMKLGLDGPPGLPSSQQLWGALWALETVPISPTFSPTT